MAEKTSFDLVGSPAVVTDAAQGIGFEIARQLHDHGADLVVFDINGEGGERTRASLAAEFPVPGNWELMKGPLGLSDAEPSEWLGAR